MYRAITQYGLGDDVYSGEVSARVQAVASVTLPAWAAVSAGLAEAIAKSVANGSLVRPLLDAIHAPIVQLRAAYNAAQTPPEWLAIAAKAELAIPALEAIEAGLNAAGAMDTGDHSNFAAWRDECRAIVNDAKARVQDFAAQISARGSVSVSGMTWVQNPDGSFTGTVVATAEGSVQVGAGAGQPSAPPTHKPPARKPPVRKPPPKKSPSKAKTYAAVGFAVVGVGVAAWLVMNAKNA